MRENIQTKNKGAIGYFRRDPTAVGPKLPLGETGNKYFAAWRQWHRVNQLDPSEDLAFQFYPKIRPCLIVFWD